MELCAHSGCQTRTAQELADTCGWRSSKRAHQVLKAAGAQSIGRGRDGLIYAITTEVENALPAEIGAKLRNIAGGRFVEAKAPCVPSFARRPRDQRRLDAIFDTLNAAREHRDRYRRDNPGATAMQADAAFIDGCNAGAPLISASTREEIRTVAVGSLKRWRRDLARGGPDALLDERGRKPGTGLIDRDENIHAVVLGMIARNAQLVRVRRIHRVLVARQAAGEIVAAPSYSALKEWVRRWRREHEADLETIANPDRARGRFRFAIGISAPEVVRPMQMVEMDNTAADVMLLVDGKPRRYAITNGIDVYSRRARSVVTPAPRAAASLLCLRKMMSAFADGARAVVPEIAHTDNGSEFKAAWFQAALADLGIRSTAALPHHAWEKPYVESFNKTLLHGLMEELDGYVGHNVAEAQAIRSRKTLADRLAMKSERREVVLFHTNLTPDDLQRHIDRWIENVYENSPHRGLGGKTPRQVWNEYQGRNGPLRTISGQRALDVLLAEVPGGGAMRVVGKQGIAVLGCAFADTALVGLEGRRVYLHYDASDISRIFVFSADRRNFICVARNADLMDAGSRNDLARAVSSLQTLRNSRVRREMRKHARAVPNPMREIVDYYAARAPAVRALDSTRPHETPEMVAAAIAAEAADNLGAPPAPHDEEVLREGADGIARLEARRAAQAVMLDDDELEALWEAVAVSGRDLTDRERRFLAHFDVSAERWRESYEGTPEYHAMLRREAMLTSASA